MFTFTLIAMAYSIFSAPAPWRFRTRSLPSLRRRSATRRQWHALGALKSLEVMWWFATAAGGFRAPQARARVPGDA